MKYLLTKVVPETLAEYRGIIASIAISALAIHAQDNFVHLAVGAGIGAGCTAYAMLKKKTDHSESGDSE